MTFLCKLLCVGTIYFALYIALYRRLQSLSKHKHSSDCRVFKPEISMNAISGAAPLVLEKPSLMCPDAYNLMVYWFIHVKTCDTRSVETREADMLFLGGSYRFCAGVRFSNCPQGNEINCSRKFRNDVFRFQYSYLVNSSLLDVLFS